VRRSQWRQTTVALIAGLPEETRDDLRDTIHFFIDSKTQKPRASFFVHFVNMFSLAHVKAYSYRTPATVIPNEICEADLQEHSAE
jgi:hypothetical protein